MQEINKNKTGLAVGMFFGVAHLGWAVLVALNWAKPLMDWVLGLHFINLQYLMNPFVWGKALWLVVITTICGYVLGWIFAACWNTFRK